MRRLRLVGMSPDGRDVRCVDDEGVEFALPADDKLRAALRGDRARLGQLEIEMDSALRPRDIQARIRAGESPEAVASLAGVNVDKIMAFCVPVIAERQHVAETARRSHVRRKGGDGHARRLSEVVGERLRGRGVDPESADWDAWRRDDGRWSVRTTYSSGERERAGTFVFDMAGRYSVADDDEARWLTGEKQSTSHGPQPREGQAGERRLSAVPDGDDLLSLTPDRDGDGDGDRDGDDLDAVMRAVREPGVEPADEPQAEPGVEPEPEAAATAVPAADDTESATTVPSEPSTKAARKSATRKGKPGTKSGTTQEKSARETSTSTSAAEPGTTGRDAAGGAAEDVPAAETEETPRRRKQRRASVPSWDEIMFGKDGSSE